MNRCFGLHVVILAVLASVAVLLGETRITFTDAEMDAAGATKPAPTTSPSSALRSDLKVNGYIVIPIAGTFGREVDPNFIGNMIASAKPLGAKHIVFLVDSPGGSVQAAEAIAAIMAKYRKEDSLQYHAFIMNRALSATISLVFGCDTIHLKNDATLGAAVSFVRTGSGSALVDAKMNSAWAASVVAIAESRGHSPVLIRAMIEEGAAAYAIKQKDGSYTFTNKPPRNSEVFDTLANGSTILTLTGKEAIKYGVAGEADSVLQMVYSLDRNGLLEVSALPFELALIQATGDQVAQRAAQFGVRLGYRAPSDLTSLRELTAKSAFRDGEKITSADMVATRIAREKNAAKERLSRWRTAMAKQYKEVNNHPEKEQFWQMFRYCFERHEKELDEYFKSWQVTADFVAKKATK